jgi:hypothetical protein
MNSLPVSSKPDSVDQRGVDGDMMKISPNMNVEEDGEDRHIERRVAYYRNVCGTTCLLVRVQAKLDRAIYFGVRLWS